MVSELRKQKDAERKEQTRQALLIAAGKVFARKGYHATLISDIVAEIGVGQGTFYRCFENKREAVELLFGQFVESMLAEFAPMQATMPTNVEEYQQASLDAVLRVARMIEENRELARMFLREGPAIDREFEELMDGVMDRFAQVAAGLLQLAIAGHFARPCKAEYVSQSIVGIGLRQMQLFLSGRLGDATIEDVATEVVDFAFWGIGPRDMARSA